VSDQTSEHSADFVLLTRLADEFAERYRRGERPSLAEYVERYPHLAADIREVFPALAEVEQVKEDHQEALGQEAAPPAPALQQLGDFRILREVGQGGMGIVYEAEQVSLGRHVALKVLPRNLLPDARAKRRFEREAKAAAKLHHTNIVPVFGVGEQDGLPYYVMQFIQGLGLDEVLDELKKLQLGNARTGTYTGGELRVSRKELSAVHVARSLLTGEFHAANDENGVGAAEAPQDAAHQEGQTADSSPAPALSDSFTLSSSSVVLPGRSRDGSKSRHRKPTYWQSVASIGAQVANALEYAHKQGIKHRDIKPSNLLLDTQGTVWVTDFGLAKADDQQNLTHTGDIVGTLRYMAPEAFDGRTDARSDVYSLGLTLYEMVALRPAFEEKERNRLIKQVTQEEPARLGKLNRHVPQDLETIVHKAIDKDPRQRYASAGAMAEDLQRFVEDEPIKARRMSQAERLWRWCRRNPAVASLTALVALLLVSSAVGTGLWAVSADSSAKREKAAAERERDAAKQADLAAEFAKQQADRATREADLSRRLLYASDMNLALQSWDAGLTGRARDLLERQWPQPGQEDLRGFEWRYLWPLCRDGSRYTLRGHTDRVTAVAFSGDGKTLATSSLDGTVRLWEVGSQRHVKLVGSTAYSAVAITPDGKTLAVVEQWAQAVRLWDVASRRERAILTPESEVWSVAISPDGKLLAVGCHDGTIRLWNVATPRELARLAGHEEPVSSVVFSPDGRTLASGGVDLTVRLWDVAARRPRATLPGHTAYVTSVAFSPDGKTLASASNDTTVRLWDTATEKPLKTLGGQRTALNSAAFSPDGKALATGAADGTIRVWEVARMEVATLLRGHTAPITALAYAPDGSLVSGSGDGAVKVWDVAIRPNPNILTGHNGMLNSLAFSPDGKTLAVADVNDKAVKLWDLATRQPIGTLRDHEKWVWFLAFAPDGRTLASVGVDLVIRLWDVPAQKLAAKLQLGGYPDSIAFSPDGKLLAAGNSAGNVQVWDLSSKQKVRELPGASKFQFSPDGTLLAGISGNTVRLWDVATWQPVADELKGGKAAVAGLAFAPDGSTLATGDAVGTLRLWDVAQKREVASRRIHASDVASLAFSPDGRRLATSGAGSAVKLWAVAPRTESIPFHDDVTLLQEVATFTGHRGPVTCVAFSPDGNTLASASADATVRLWQAPPLSAVLPEPADLARVLSERGHPLELRKEWQKAIAEYTKALEFDPDSVEAYRHRGRCYAALAQFDNAASDFAQVLARTPEPPNPWPGDSLGIAHEVARRDDLFARVIKLRPNDRTLGIARVNHLACRGLWKEAAAVLAGVIELDPSDHLAWYHQSVLLIELRDIEGYRRVCREMLARFSEPNGPPNVAERTAKTCLLMPDAVRDLQPVLKLADVALTGTEAHGDYRWFLLARGMADYRAGRFVEAIDRLKKVLSPSIIVNLYRDTMAHLFLAMAHQKLGKSDEARSALDRARELVAQKFPKPDGVGLDDSWDDWLRCQIVLREAEKVVEGKLQPKVPGTNE
jgi:WD40 repeat protein/serine/threonine protein kinase